MNNKQLYFKIYDIFGKRFASKANSILEKSQYWSRKEIENYQLDHLKKLITNAKNNIPYYQKTIERFPKGSWNYNDMILYMQDIPILTKEHVQNSFEELIDPNVDRNKLIYQRSGGTTGHPTQFYHDREKLDYTRVALQRNFDWAGYSLRKKCLKLASGQYEVTINKGIKGKIKNRLFNRSFYEGAFLTNDLWAQEVLEIIKKQKIKVLWGYSSIIYMLARELENEKDLGIESIITSSETLLVSQRNKIEKTFQCKVFDDYGSREFMIAAECEAHEGMHINEELLLLEIVNDGGSICSPGQSGDLIITDFFNLSFPFIRFQIGDRGSLFENEQACSCGRNLKRLEQLEGRSSETIKIDNIVISQSIFPDYFKTVRNIEAYQILVYKNSIEINVILYDSTDLKTITEIKQHLVQRFQGKIPVRIHLTTQLIQESNGKVLVVKKMD